MNNREKVKELAEEIEKITRNEKEKVERIFDMTTSHQWSDNKEYNLLFLKAQQNYFNDMLKCRGYVYLNEVYDGLGLSRTTTGAIAGWAKENNSTIMFDVDECNNVFMIDFNIDGVILHLIGEEA